MYRLLKKSRLVVAVVLLCQAVTLFFLFLLQIAKRKSLAMAFLAVSAFEGTTGGWLIWQLIEEDKEKKVTERQKREMEENPEGFTIPLDEKASEKEFQ